jgi:phage head maturation protease
MTRLITRSWNAPTQDCRFADIAPTSYDKSSRSCECVISTGSGVQRFYGLEKLRIDDRSVKLDRVHSGGIPVLDSHSQASVLATLGRIDAAWIRSKTLLGRITFNATDEGKKAEGMVARGEIAGVSAGYRVDDWEITDEDGNILNPDRDKIRYDDNLTFTATKWELFECSLVAVPADAGSGIRSLGNHRSTYCDRPIIAPLAMGGPSQSVIATRARMQARQEVSDIRARMWARQRMIERWINRHD